VHLRHTLPIMALTALGACTPRPAPVAAGPDLNVGIASVCTPSDPKLVPGAVSEATITMSNEGGWCAVRVAENGHPYALGLLPGRPEHGRALIRKAGEQTFLDYVPAAGYTGPDSFTVKLRSATPGEADPSVHVTVMVQPKS